MSHDHAHPHGDTHNPAGGVRLHAAAGLHESIIQAQTGRAGRLLILTLLGGMLVITSFIAESLFSDSVAQASDGTMRGAGELNTAFAEAGADMGRPIVTSCGSGVTASMLLLGLHLIGHGDLSLYDGSWSEWGSRQDTPIVSG